MKKHLTLKEMLNNKKLVLDVGCGYPNTIEPYVKRGDIGIDHKRGYADVIADAHYLPFQNNVFTQVNVYSTLDHLVEPYKALKEIYRVSNNKSNLCVEVSNCDFWSYSFNKASPEHFFQWNKWTLTNLLNKTGFHNVTVSTVKLDTYKDSKWDVIRQVVEQYYSPCQAEFFNSEIIHVEATK